jgi:hypothetical protein
MLRTKITAFYGLNTSSIKPTTEKLGERLLANLEEEEALVPSADEDFLMSQSVGLRPALLSLVPSPCS